MTADEKPFTAELRIEPMRVPDGVDAQALADALTKHLDAQNQRLLMLHGKYSPLPSETQP